MDIRINANHLRDVAQLWEQAPEIVRREMLAAVTEGDLLLTREVKELTPVGVGGAGGLRGSITSREQVLSDNVIGMVSSSAAHALPVELGTKPHHPPIQPIEDWVRHKLDIPEAEASSVAWAIAKKIAKVGTKGAKMFETAFEANQPQLQSMFAAANERIAVAMTTGGGA